MVKKTIIPATKKLGKELLKEASPEHKLRVCAYVRVSTIGECLSNKHHHHKNNIKHEPYVI